MLVQQSSWLIRINGKVTVEEYISIEIARILGAISIEISSSIDIFLMILSAGVALTLCWWPSAYLAEILLFTVFLKIQEVESILGVLNVRINDFLERVNFIC